jgi:hypothetical protein
LQEQQIFPYLRSQQSGAEDIERALRQFEYEHAHGNALMIEIIETAVTGGFRLSFVVIACTSRDISQLQVPSREPLILLNCLT